MKGGIFSDQGCPLCGARYRDDGRRGLSCPNHPEQYANRFSVRFRKVHKRFNSYETASRFLTGLRFQTDHGHFDPRDWQRDKPLSFGYLSAAWLEVKQKEVKPSSYRNLRNYIERTRIHLGDMNIKHIGYAELEDFFQTQTDLSGKTRANIRSCLHSFWTWLKKRQVITLSQMPEFPHISYTLGLRKMVDKDTQSAIVEEVRRISNELNPKIWIGIKWLCTYISLRPGDLVRLKEQDIATEQGLIIIKDPTKSRKPKIIPLLDEDIEIVTAAPRGFPQFHFFRHAKKTRGVQEGAPFGEKYFYKWWKRACLNLGIEDVDLYGGTRHSSACALRKFRTPEEIKRATMHETNRAFERYFRIEGDDLRSIYEDTKLSPKTSGKKLVTKNKGTKDAKVLDFKT